LSRCTRLIQGFQPVFDGLQLHSFRNGDASLPGKVAPIALSDEVVIELLPTPDQSLVFFLKRKPGPASVDGWIHSYGDIFDDSDGN
jgi:hypothetical protein